MKPADVGLKAIRWYRRSVSPSTTTKCRYQPTCSAYAEEAVSEFGLLRGGWISAKRLVRCHPWARGGYDPPPLKNKTFKNEK